MKTRYTLPLLFVAALAACSSDSVLETKFDHPPRHDEWSYRTTLDRDGAWSPTDGGSISAASGYWESPYFPLKPEGWYAIDLESISRGPVLWATMFIGDHNIQLRADVYTTIDPSASWHTTTTCFRARPDAEGAVLHLAPSGLWSTVPERITAQYATPLPEDQTPSDVRLRSVRLRTVDPLFVANWVDGVAAGLPKIEYTPPPDRWRFIPQTLAALQNRRPLRIVFLGDSIANDTSTSAWDTLLERDLPGLHLTVIPSIRGGTGCTYYQSHDRVTPFVLDYHPDLVVIMGISHSFQLDPIRSVIQQIRARCGAEIIVGTGTVTPSERRVFDSHHRPVPRDEADAKIDAFNASLQAMAAQEHVGFLDLETPWRTYSRRPDVDPDMLHRDPFHSSDRGRAILAKLMEAYFKP